MRFDFVDLRLFGAIASLGNLTKAAEGFPIDAEQVEKESLEIPEWSDVLDRIAVGGWEGEAEVIREVAEGL